MHRSLARLTLLCLLASALLAGCGEDKAVKVEGAHDGVVKRDIDAAKGVAAKQSNFQHDGESILSGTK